MAQSFQQFPSSVVLFPSEHFPLILFFIFPFTLTSFFKKLYTDNKEAHRVRNLPPRREERKPDPVKVYGRITVFPLCQRGSIACMSWLTTSGGAGIQRRAPFTAPLIPTYGNRWDTIPFAFSARSNRSISKKRLRIRSISTSMIA